MRPAARSRWSVTLPSRQQVAEQNGVLGFQVAEKSSQPQTEHEVATTRSSMGLRQGPQYTIGRPISSAPT